MQCRIEKYVSSSHSDDKLYVPVSLTYPAIGDISILYISDVLHSWCGVIHIVSYEIRIVHVATYVFAVVGNNFNQQR